MTKRPWYADPVRLSPLLGISVIFFIANIPPFVLAFLLMSPKAFTAFSLLYLGLISILAMVAGCGSWWQSLQVQIHQEDDADVQEVLDEVRTLEP